MLGGDWGRQAARGSSGKSVRDRKVARQMHTTGKVDHKIAVKVE